MAEPAPGTPETERLTEAVAGVLPALLETLGALEAAQRHLHPARLPELGVALAPLGPELAAALAALEGVAWPERLAVLGERLATAGREARGALERCVRAGESARRDPHDVQGGFVEWIRALRGRARALEALYPLASALAPVSAFFLEAPVRGDQQLRERLRAGARAAADPAARTPVGILHSGNERGERGGFSLYVPEYYAPEREWPLVVALHGGSGHGADFLWQWLREARSRGLVLLAPTAQGGTWSMTGPDVDGPALARMVAFARSQWRLDPGRVLLTGMSDGATYASLAGLAEGAPYTALALACGVFHPANAVNGNLARASGRRVYLLHGAQDWMFPVETARAARDQLRAAGAHVTYREVPDLAHTYPRDENDAILRWFDSSLALGCGARAPPARPGRRS